MTEHRPSADALLERIKEKDRARLRIYVGAAPGVGKTHQMLQEAHGLRASGLDIVVGVVGALHGGAVGGAACRCSSSAW